MQTLASSPATKMYLSEGGNESLEADMLAQLEAINEIFDDGNVTIITSKSGKQLLRTDGNTLADAAGSDDFETAIKGQIYISNAMASKSTGEMIMTIIVPVYGFDNSVIGLVQRNYALSAVHDFLAANAEDAFVVDRDAIIAAHSQFTVSAEDEPKSVAGDAFMTSSASSGFYEVVNHSNNSRSYLAYVREPISGYTVAVSFSKSVVMASAQRSAAIVIIVGVILLIIAVIISIIMAKAFTSPIKDINKSLSDLSEGRFTNITSNKGRKDEFGHMIENTNSVITTLGNIVSKIKQSASSVGSSSEELADMANQISQTADDVSTAVQEIATGATQQADEIQGASENVGLIGDAVSDVQNSTNNTVDNVEATMGQTMASINDGNTPQNPEPLHSTINTNPMQTTLTETSVNQNQFNAMPQEPDPMLEHMAENSVPGSDLNNAFSANQGAFSSPNPSDVYKNSAAMNYANNAQSQVNFNQQQQQPQQHQQQSDN